MQLNSVTQLNSIILLLPLFIDILFAMKYYIVDSSSDWSVVGNHYPQVHDFIKGYNPDESANGIFALYDPFLFPTVTPNLSGLKLASGANYTDFLSQGFSGDLFLFNEKAKSVLDTIHIDKEHKIYPAKVISLRKKMEKDYYMMKIISENFHHVDFANSVITRNVDNVKMPIEVSSCQEFMMTYRNKEKRGEWDRSLQFSQIKMSQEFYDLHLDLFQIGKIDFLWYASPKFVNAIVAKGLTGLQFEEVEL